MGYRVKEHPKPHPHRDVKDVTTPIKLFVHQGALVHFAFPCWYQEVHKPVEAYPHNSRLHDHRGWPGPTKPDHVCQHWIPKDPHCRLGCTDECSPHCRMFLDLRSLVPIHLKKEGYKEIVAFLDGSEDYGQNYVNAYIDGLDDWVVRLDIMIAEDEYDAEEPIFHDIVLYADGDDGEMRFHDLVIKAKLVVLPANADFYTDETEIGEDDE